MKLISLFFLCIVSQIPTVVAQNTGIGITTPRARLHVFAGSAANDFPFGPFVVESNSNTYINLLSPNFNETSILFGKSDHAAHGGIVYNNAANLNGLQFRTNGNITRFVITNNGNLGIGVLNPTVPLGFAPSLGKKITLYPGATGDVGFGVQGNLLQIYSDNPNADIAFGYDQAGTMTERFRMRSNGALLVNGNAGQSGQALTSKGGNAVEWVSPTNAVYNNMVQYFQTATMLSVGGYVPVTGLTQTFTAPKSKAIIVVKGQLFNLGCFGCGNRNYKVDIMMDGVLIDRTISQMGNGLEGIYTNGALIFELTPGTHTIAVNIDGHGGNYSVSGFRVVITMIPE